jgi:YVTN family beta-propeller protein
MCKRRVGHLQRLVWLIRCTWVALLFGTVPALLGATSESSKHSVYLGVQACAKCHTDAVSGHQFTRWRISAHARAFAVLALPESRKIAALSGIPEEPQKAKMCLGCHATAVEAETWELTESFHPEDGLQCEACHGAGSEYASKEVMLDRKQAMARGLILPDHQASCTVCHRPKGSHEAVLIKKARDPQTAWLQIAHPMPSPPPKLEPAARKLPERSSGKFKFVGVMVCAECHQQAKLGYQFSQWRQSSHAQAYAALATPRAYEIARRAGLKGDPQQSADCLACHTTGYGYDRASFRDSIRLLDGVQCEACHGPGSEYSAEAVMLDKPGARNAGLLPVSEKTCRQCHQKPHGKPFDYQAALRQIRHPAKAPPVTDGPRYKTPLNLAVSPDGREIWVACEAANSVIVVDTADRRKVAEVPVGGKPTDVAFDPAGRRVFVSNRLDDSVSVVDVRSRKLTATLPVGNEPHGVLLDREGKHLYVLNTSIDSISVFDAQTLQEVKRLTGSRSPWSLALSPDGRRILVTHELSRFVPRRTTSMSEVAVIDAENAIIEDRLVVRSANLVQGVAWHPSGEYAVVTLLRTKNLVPMTRLLRDWTISNGLGVVCRDGTVDQVLLDQPDMCFPDPAAISITPDGKYALVTSSSTDRVAVVDLARLTAMLRAASAAEREHVFPNHLGKATEFVVKFIRTGICPRGIRCASHGSVAYVANALDDSVTVIDLQKLEAVDAIDLGGPKEITNTRWGERLFNSANNAFHRQFSCHTCHPDGHIDGITYDTEPDGIGISPVDNRTLRGILDTAPFKWEGTNPSLRRQCGPRLAVFFTRIQPFTPDELSAVENYICTIPRPPNRYRKLGESLTPAQRRGKQMFERTRTNDGRGIPVMGQCITCHPPPLYTNGKVHDVGTQQPDDRQGKFDVPHLNNIYDSAPYLHSGMADTLEEIWTRYNPYDQHGVTNDMTKDQLNDLIEYLKTL